MKQEKTLKFNLSIHVLKSITNSLPINNPMTEKVCPRDLVSLSQNDPHQIVGQVQKTPTCPVRQTLHFSLHQSCSETSWHNSKSQSTNFIPRKLRLHICRWNLSHLYSTPFTKVYLEAKKVEAHIKHNKTYQNEQNFLIPSQLPQLVRIQTVGFCHE
jgi:hypothetical protein